MKISKQQLKRGLLVFCGYLYLWIVVVNVAGQLLITDDMYQSKSCVPYWGMFGIFGFKCPIRILDTLFFIIADIPRMLIAPAYLAVTVIKEGIHRKEYGESLLTALRWLMWSIPFFLIAAPGFYFWQKKFWIIGWLMTLMLTSLIIYIGLIA